MVQALESPPNVSSVLPGVPRPKAHGPRTPGLAERNRLTKHPKDTRGYQIVLVRENAQGLLEFHTLSRASSFKDAQWDAKAAKSHNDYQSNQRSWIKVLEITTSGQIWCEAVYLASQKPLGRANGDVLITPQGWE